MAIRFQSHFVGRACAIPLAFAIAVTASGLASGQQMLHTSNGFTIEPRPVEQLSCGELSEQLSTIDETGYRSGGPLPANGSDEAVYDYELKLSVAFFWRCSTQVDEEIETSTFGSAFTDRNNQ